MDTIAANLSPVDLSFLPKRKCVLFISYYINSLIHTPFHHEFTEEWGKPSEPLYVGVDINHSRLTLPTKGNLTFHLFEKKIYLRNDTLEELEIVNPSSTALPFKVEVNDTVQLRNNDIIKPIIPPPVGDENFDHHHPNSSFPQKQLSNSSAGGQMVDGKHLFSIDQCKWTIKVNYTWAIENQNQIILVPSSPSPSFPSSIKEENKENKKGSTNKSPKESKKESTNTTPKESTPKTSNVRNKTPTKSPSKSSRKRTSTPKKKRKLDEDQVEEIDLNLIDSDLSDFERKPKKKEIIIPPEEIDYSLISSDLSD